MAVLENAYGLVVGIANYDTINALPGTVLQDARDIHELLIDPNCCGYPEQNVQLLLDQQASRTGIRDALAKLAAQTNENSTVFFYLSSHGGRIESGPDAGVYLLPVDTSYTDDAALARTSISGFEFSEALRKISARKLVVIFDCCHSGGFVQLKDAAPTNFKSGLDESYYDQLKVGRGRAVISSSRSNEKSYVLPGASNSLFTKHFLAALRGGASGSGGLIRVFDIFDYLQPRVTAERSEQHPLFKAELEENFPVALYLGGKAADVSIEAAPNDGFAYDLFISYRHQEPDKTWVRKTLVPRLKAEGLRICVDFESFAISGLVINEMERAVEQSRYTVSILSPSYLKSNFAQFEEVLATHLGLEKRQQRYIGIMFQPCTPSLRIRARFWLDMTSNEEFEESFPRLVQQARLSPAS
ncbi:MAG TPA: caspase family protein [Pyrinomonadaceae bacterium]|nr:caspase family protein [Pyrinomonadaceae bacterium]